MEHSAIIQVFALGNQWPTIDPFLFVAHHRDDYPAGNGELGPAEALTGRQIGQDFADVNGWNMYHGQKTPGFPQHPHRGFETITYVRHGLADHSDSLGATARFGRGDVQWMTAGAGIVHAEMFPLIDEQDRNPMELFQIWLNLPSVDKMVDPYFTMIWDENVPKIETVDDEGRTTTVTVITGRFGDVEPQASPPNSWAARTEAEVGLWHGRLDAGASWELPAGSPTITRVIYIFGGSSVTIEEQAIPAGNGVAVDAEQALSLTAGDGEVEFLIMQGQPINEPVAQQGPFVMNTQAELQQAFSDYRSTQFGGWPWPTDGPVHAGERGRFAIHPDGRTEIPA